MLKHKIIKEDYAMNDFKKISQNIENAFDNIMQYIIKDKCIDVFALSNDNSSDNHDSINQQVTSIKIMTFYLLAENKQSEKLVGLISSAINSYINSSITVSSSELNKNIDIDLDKVYSDFNKVYKIFRKKHSDSYKLEMAKLIKEKFSMDNNKKEHIIFILNMLYQFTANESRELFLTYIPSIIYTFYSNYNKGINTCIKKLKVRTAKKDQISTVMDLLTTVSVDIQKYSTRDYVRRHKNTIKSFLFISLYNAIITNYNKNFIVDFLWFEQNVGFYQYYLTGEEYSKVINYISEFSASTTPKIDISIPTALYLRFKDNTFDEKLWEAFNLILTANNALNNEEIYNFMNEIFTNAVYDFDLDYDSVMGYFSKESISELCPLQRRFMTYSVQALYYHDLLYKENFIKNNMNFYAFHCDEISDDDFKLEDVTFNMWYTSDFTVEDEFSIINLDKKYYIVSPVLNKNDHIESELLLNDSIISTRKIKKIWLRDELIDTKAIAILKLENVKFKNLSVKNKPIDYNATRNWFTSKDIVEAFDKINHTDTHKIYVFLGLHYFTNIEDYPQGRKNVVALYTNGLMGYQNFLPIRGTLDYTEIPITIDRYLKTLRIYGLSTASSCSTSCNGSGVICTSNNISTNCSNLHSIFAEGSTQNNTSISCIGSCSTNSSSEVEQPDEK